MSGRFLALYFDFGDTLIDQATEVKDESFTTLQAELIPGAAELLHELKHRGYRLGLVSNGPVGSIPNVLGARGLYELFDVLAVSQGLGVDKPDARIFRYALDHMGIPESEYDRTIMIGNDLAADVAGANAMGMISVWLDWAPRHRKTPTSEAEIPHHTIAEPLELLSLLEELEQRL
ncbi:MAG TPA: HAD-IA family hydrolase [Anaerolineales bacterium]|nr:HAD-IA family hydrolase [Anaerolineales bacterium]